MYAADNLGDALRVTKRYLHALGVAGYLKLGLLILLIGGLGLLYQVFNIPAELAMQGVGDTDTLAIVAVVAASLLLVFLLLRYLAAILEFVYVESLRSEEMHLRRYVRANLKNGLLLLAFRIALWIVVGGLFVALVAAVVLGGDVGAPDDLTAGQLGALLLAGFVFGVVGWIVSVLTNAFVVPTMLHEGRGPISGWRRVAGSMGPNWTGLLAFLLVGFVLGAAIVFLYAGIYFAAFFFGIFLFAILLVLALAIHEALGIVVLVVLLLGYLLFEYAFSLLETPIRTYVRYYALLLLGDTDDSLDLIPEQRQAVRAPTGAATGGTGPQPGPAASGQPVGSGSPGFTTGAGEGSATGSGTDTGPTARSEEEPDDPDETAVWGDSPSWGSDASWDVAADGNDRSHPDDGDDSSDQEFDTDVPRTDPDDADTDTDDETDDWGPGR
ncbi:DUF7544 domain-containing protein [Natrarchaeobaculum aegyptiacum]|uniref:DUF4013 domain-containing protein n=1 Tax=Natrarchaeobaculum aegyptiacum TaxID=745377 RepID=A0A2Z2HUQ9_9EURY|nr:hypothetical protein [Natrarchaeobaculum aegyptiacum]ARS90920.1 hypothetical protein B1756_15080 [Natrarchaeobaculum aegyptiacum]